MTVTTYSANHRAELTVSDEGTGIPQRVQGRIFERFYTADSAGGSGLGLAIASELAQRMDGRIAITSSKRFTAFTLDLPPVAPGTGRRGDRRARRRGPAREAPGRGLCAARRAGGWRSSPAAAAPAAARPPPRRRPAANARRRRLSSRPPSSGFDAARVYREASPGVVTIRSVFGEGSGPSAAEGSGFVLDNERRIVTNAHVVTEESEAAGASPAKAVFVEFPDRNVVPAKIVGFDPFADVALLEVKPDGLPPAPAEARRRRRPGRRPAGGGDRQPLRRAAVALGRRRLGHRPLGQIADPVPDRGGDPDRRLDQPRQLRRPAARRRCPA